MPSIDANRSATNLATANAAPQAVAAAPVVAQPSMPTDSASFTAPDSATAPADPLIAPAANDPSTVPAASLTTEEQDLLAQHLLPTNYAQLKQLAQTQGVDAATAFYRQGMKGPFSKNFGNPHDILSNARVVAKDPGLLQMFKDTKKGDIILIDYNDPKEFIAGVTKGPFTHTMLCTDTGPLPQFMEAIGLTGSQNDPSNNRVRRAGYNDLFGTGVSYRKISPAGQLPEPQRSKAIDDAVNYAVDHLGKPYDYTFGQTKVGQAFICSSLAYYAYAAGAHLDIPVSKSNDRDILVRALGSMTDALAPKDRLALMSKVANMINRKPPPTQQELVKFAVEDVLPSCYTTAKLCKSPQDQANLEAAIAKFTSGKGMPRFDAAHTRYDTDEKAGRFKTPILGFFRKQIDRVRIGTSAFSDAYHAFDGTGMSRLKTLGAMWKLAGAALPYSEALSALAFGQHSSPTKTMGTVLNTTEWFKNHKPFSWVTGWLPARAAVRVDKEFISPTDLAWAKLPHSDYNVPPGVSLDRPTGT